MTDAANVSYSAGSHRWNCQNHSTDSAADATQLRVKTSLPSRENIPAISAERV